MKKYFLKKLLAVCTALSLLSSSAFAASFGDLQDAIDGNTGAGEFIGMHGDDHYGYGKNEDGSYGVESWTTTTENEDGTTTSSNNVQLNEDVSKEDGSKDRLVVGEEDGSVTIDLNGNDITSDNYDPEVGTANNGTPGAGGEYGSVITVGQGADLTLKDTSSDNAAEQGVISGGFGVYDGGGGILVDGGALNMEGGNISGNASYTGGGGVGVKGDGEFNMSGGAISGNIGGGVTVNDHDAWEQSHFTMNGGTISGNKAQNNGGGVYAPGKSEVAINGGGISGNTAGITGGGIDAGNLTMNGGKVSENESGKGGGGINVGNLQLNGGTIEKNTAHDGEGGGIHINGTAEITGSKGNVYIRDNRTETKSDLGGGGVYVHTNGKLTLTNVVVYGNTAGIMGGGLAACQTGRTFVYATDGGAFFDNHGLGLDNDSWKSWTDAEWDAFFEDVDATSLNANCDGGSVWKNWSGDQKRLFVQAAQDIFTASLGGYGSYDAGAVVGNVMLGYDQQLGNDPSELTPEQIAEVAEHLANWTGYSVRFEKPDQLDKVGEGNNGTIFGDRFLVLTAKPTEEAKQAAMDAGKVFITGNTSSNHGGGIANNGTLIIGKETQGVSTVRTDLNKEWVDAEGENIELEGGDFSFIMSGGLVSGTVGGAYQKRI